MKKIKIIHSTWFNQLEAELNKLLNEDSWEIKAVYSDGKAHYAVLQKEE